MVDILAEDFENATNSTNFNHFHKFSTKPPFCHGVKITENQPSYNQAICQKFKITKQTMDLVVLSDSDLDQIFEKNFSKILDKILRLFCDDMIILKLQNSSFKAASSTFLSNP